MDERTVHLVLAGCLGAAGVALGAFGAHALAGVLPVRMLEVWETASRYHLFHALALLAVAAAERPWRSRWCAWACRGWALGTVLFSGSLYLLALTGERWLGAVTPIGGLALVAGWLCLALAAWRARGSSSPD